MAKFRFPNIRWEPSLTIFNVASHGQSEEYNFTSLGTKETQAVLNKVNEIFKSEIRCASVSIVETDANIPPDFQYIATAPAGRSIFFSARLHDLLGECNFQTLEELNDWSEGASKRGLFHYWIFIQSSENATKSKLREKYIKKVSKLISATTADPQVCEPNPIHGNKLSVAVDLTWMSTKMTGAQISVIELIKQLDRSEEISHMHLLTPKLLEKSFVDSVNVSEKVTFGASNPDKTFDILWRPIQPDREFDPTFKCLKYLRVVITFLDTIAYDNRSYRKSKRLWNNYRQHQRYCASHADVVSVISEDVSKQLLLRMPFLDPQRLRVNYLGTTHLETTNKAAKKLEAKSGFKSTEYVLFLGTDYPHKNLDFAIQVVQRTRSIRPGLRLVVAGISMPLDQHEGQISLPEWVTRVGHVSEEEKCDLIEKCSALIYPTSAEGFGLVPYEGASFDKATIFTNFGPLQELLGDLQMPDSWSVTEYVALLEMVLSDTEFERGLVKQLDDTMTSLTWERSVESLLENFYFALSLPKVSAQNYIKRVNKIQKYIEAIELMLRVRR